MIPKHLWRHPTPAAIEALALKFDLPNTQDMQDWEYEVADANRIDEFIAAYQSGQLDDDERFTLMEVIIQSFEDIGDHLDTDPRWQTVINLLDTNIKLHASTVWYWGNPEECDPEDCWSVTASINRIWIKRRNDVMTVS